MDFAFYILSMKRILYIGNKQNRKSLTPTTLDTLSVLLEKEGFQIRTASAKKKKVLRLAEMILKVFKFRKETDLVLIDTYSTQNFYYASIIARCCKFFKLPYIPILHGGNLPERLKNDPQKCDFLFNNAKLNVSPSLYLMKVFKDFGYSNVIHIPNSIQLENYPFLKRAIKPKLFWVRSFSEIYNPMLALKVVEKLLPVYPETSLCMVGPDKDGSLSLCKSYAQKNNLPVTFTGKLEKKDWIILAKDYSMFINTTHFDNMPISVIEAMALGLPVVSTNVGGIPFLLEDQKDALLVEPNDELLFSSAINELLQNPKLATQLAENARLKVENYDWEKVKFQWFDILNE